MISTENYVYKVTGDCEIRANVHRPLGEAVCPAILWLHGGALMFGHRGAIAPEQVRRYVEAGYAVVSVDYRLAPEAKLDGIIADLQDAYAWLRGQGPDAFRIDPERIAVIGHSAGGYLALMAGFCVSPRPRALVSFYGYGDIAGDWYSRPDRHYNQQPAVPEDEAHQAIGSCAIAGTSFEDGSAEARWRLYLYCRQQGLWPKLVTGHDPDEESDWFDAFCPLRNVTECYPPTLLIHGEQDTDVPFEQSVLMARELERHGVAHELIALEDRGHGFENASDGLHDPVVAGVFERVLGFLDERLW